VLSGPVWCKGRNGGRPDGSAVVKGVQSLLWKVFIYSILTGRATHVKPQSLVQLQ
jgi:hypothetical protein